MAAAEEEVVMKSFIFGKIEVDVEKRAAGSDLTEFIVKVGAPGVQPFTFHTFRETSLQWGERTIARNLLLTIRRSWTNPTDFISEAVWNAAQNTNLEEAETAAGTARREAVEIAQFASAIDPYLAEVPEWGNPHTRSPREWLPPRKKT